MSKRFVKFSFKVIISILFLAFLFLKVDKQQIFNSFTEIDFKFYFLSLLIGFISTLFIAGKHYILIKKTIIERRFFFILKICFTSRFYAIFLPSGISQDAIRWYKVTKTQKTGKLIYFTAIVFERFVFLLILLVFGTIPLFYYSSNSGISSLRNLILPFFTISVSFICLTLICFFSPNLRNRLSSVISGFIPNRWKDIPLSDFIGNFSVKTRAFPIAIWTVLLSLAFQSLFILRLFLLVRATGIPLSIIDIAWMGSLVLILQILPISFAGLGVREGAYAYLFTLYNLEPESGVLIGILFFSQMLFISIFGGFLELMEK